MSYGKQSGSTATTPINSPEQRQLASNQAALWGSQVGPQVATVLQGGTDIYNQTAPGYNAAATNLAGAANAAQNILGTGGSSAYTSGINALQNIAGPEYQQAQLNAAMIPAQLQYQQNIAAQNAGFGGAGQLNSARQALAQQQLAGLTQQQQQVASAQALNNITNQQLQAAQNLGSLGQAGIQGAIGAGQTGMAAAASPMDLFQKYAGLLGQIPSSAYTPNWSGMTGQNVQTQGSNTGISI